MAHERERVGQEKRARADVERRDAVREIDDWASGRDLVDHGVTTPTHSLRNPKSERKTIDRVIDATREASRLSRPRCNLEPASGSGVRLPLPFTSARPAAS